MIALRPPLLRRLLVACLAALPLLAAPAIAQGFDADRYLNQCLAFERGGDLVSAREACRNTLQIESDSVQAQLALSRIEIALAEPGGSETRLRDLVGRTESAEPSLLLARLTLDQQRLTETAGHLSEARRRLDDDGDRTLQARLAFLSGRLAQARGRVDEALDAYAEAVAQDGLEVEYRLADARLRFDIGDASGARSQLASYQLVSGDDRDPRVRSLLGRALWAEGEMEQAAGQLETALALWNPRQTGALSDDLRTLGLVYLGQGDVTSGTLALREAGRRGNQLGLLSANALLWAALLIGLLVAHLLAESRIESRSTLEVVEGPQVWSVGRVYGVLLVSVLVALLVGIGAGMLMYDNLLAILTPHQAGEIRAIVWVVLALTATLLSVRHVRKAGWQVEPRLLGTGVPGAWSTGLGVGLGLLALTLAYLAIRPPDSGLLSPLWVDLSRLTPSLIAAMITLPLLELFFRPFAFDALEHRYDRGSALAISAALSTVVMFSPVVLLLPIGLLLSELYRRHRSGLLPLVAMLTLHVGLVLATVFSPWARGLFF